jgi:hypothetical protein
MKLKTIVAAFGLLLSLCASPLALAQDKDAKEGAPAKTHTAKAKHSAAWYKTHAKKASSTESKATDKK